MLAYLTAFRDLGWLDLPQYTALRPYEEAAEAGFRCPHREFCVVSDNPTILKMDRQNRPHCEDGPSHQWRDGWALYHWHGVRVPAHVIVRPETITIEEIAGADSAEVRRVMIERYGIERYLSDTQTSVVHADSYHGAHRILVRDQYGDKFLYGSDGSTGRIYAMPVSEDATTCREAHESICGFDETTLQEQS
jgi:hypothetical protein